MGRGLVFEKNRQIKQPEEGVFRVHNQGRGRGGRI